MLWADGDWDIGAVSEVVAVLLSPFSPLEGSGPAGGIKRESLGLQAMEARKPDLSKQVSLTQNPMTPSTQNWEPVVNNLLLAQFATPAQATGEQALQERQSLDGMRGACSFQLLPWHKRGEEHPAVVRVQPAANWHMELLDC